MDIEVRPATKTEQMYCYTQSDQIMGQTGCIGHLRADMGDSGDQFFHDWTSHCERLLTPEFDDEFNQLINQLREDDGFLKSRAAVSAYCYRQIDSAIDLAGQDFAFRYKGLFLSSAAESTERNVYGLLLLLQERVSGPSFASGRKRDSLYHIGLYGALSPARWR